MPARDSEGRPGGYASWDAMAWAFRVEGLAPREKSVLVALAHHASERNGDWVWPGQTRLSEMTGYSRRTIGRAVATLETTGLIRRQRRHLDNGNRSVDFIELQYGRSEALAPGQSATASRSQAEALAPGQGQGDNLSPHHVTTRPGLGDNGSQEPQGTSIEEPISISQERELGSGDSGSAGAEVPTLEQIHALRASIKQSVEANRMVSAVGGNR